MRIEPSLLNLTSFVRSKFIRNTFAPAMLAVAALLAFSASQAISQTPAPKSAMPAKPAGVDIPIPDIKYTKFVLANGLTVLVHEDHKAPIVAVNTCAIARAKFIRGFRRQGFHFAVIRKTVVQRPRLHRSPCQPT